MKFALSSLSLQEFHIISYIIIKNFPTEDMQGHLRYETYLQGDR